MASLAFGMGKCSLCNLKVLISEWYLISDQGCVFIKVCNDAQVYFSVLPILCKLIYIEIRSRTCYVLQIHNTINKHNLLHFSINIGR